MPSLRILSEFYLVVAIVGVCAIISLQLRVLWRFRHKSFAVLALGSFLGLVFVAIELLLIISPKLVSDQRLLYSVALIIGACQVPLVVWGTAWLFRSYGQLSKQK
jgi:hypothetical protein